MTEYGPNFEKGVGIAFGPDVTQKWCELNKVSGIIRSHEVRQGKCAPFSLKETFLINLCVAGYQIEHGGLCTTVSPPPPFA